jgi:hypothetical protein
VDRSKLAILVLIAGLVLTPIIWLAAGFKLAELVTRAL